MSVSCASDSEASAGFDELVRRLQRLALLSRNWHRLEWDPHHVAGYAGVTILVFQMTFTVRCRPECITNVYIHVPLRASKRHGKPSLTVSEWQLPAVPVSQAVLTLLSAVVWCIWQTSSRAPVELLGGSARPLTGYKNINLEMNASISHPQLL